MSGKLDRSGLKVDDLHNYYYKSQKKLPGPGHYQQPDVIGNSLNMSQFSTSRIPIFSKANDRFVTVPERRVSPAPN